MQVQAHEEHEAKQAERLVDEDPIISVDKGVPRVMTFDYWMSQWDRKKKKHRKQTNGLIHAMKQYNEFIKGNVRVGVVCDVVCVFVARGRESVDGGGGVRKFHSSPRYYNPVGAPPPALLCQFCPRPHIFRPHPPPFLHAPPPQCCTTVQRQVLL